MASSTAARAWFVVTALGQAIFLFYIVGFYAPPAWRGTPEQWSIHKKLIDGHVAGDGFGNLMFGVHVLLAAVLTLGGMLQLWPALRRARPRLHRWNGRLFAVAALLAATGGLWLVWGRGSRLGMASDLGITMNAVLVVACVTMAYRAARARRFASHEVWAVRAFLAVSGVWFLRVGMMAFALVAIGALGQDKALARGFFGVWSFGSTLLPLATYEVYRRASPRFPAAMAAGLGALTLLTAIGITGATLMMWLPPLRSAGVLG